MTPYSQLQVQLEVRPYVMIRISRSYWQFNVQRIICSCSLCVFLHLLKLKKSFDKIKQKKKTLRGILILILCELSAINLNFWKMKMLFFSQRFSLQWFQSLFSIRIIYRIYIPLKLINILTMAVFLHWLHQRIHIMIFYYQYKAR